MSPVIAELLIRARLSDLASEAMAARRAHDARRFARTPRMPRVPLLPGREPTPRSPLPGDLGGWAASGPSR